jgi:hypothetical protein
MTNAPPSSAPEEQTVALSEPGVAFGIDETDDLELIRQTLGGMFAFLPPGNLRPRSSARSVGVCEITIPRRQRITAGTHFAASEWKTMPAWLTPLRETVGKWSEHKDARLGAALAYYSVFSLGPLILIAIAIVGLVFGAEAVQGQVLGTLKRLVGDTGTQAIEAMLKGADRQ